MASVNKVILVGNLGRDPEMRYSPDGAAMCNFSIATTSQWKDKATGERREDTEWHRIVIYNRLAEVAGEYLKKGRSVYIEGRMKTRKWQDKHTGSDRYTTEVIADQMQMLGGTPPSDGGHAADAPDGADERRRGRATTQDDACDRPRYPLLNESLNHPRPGGISPLSRFDPPATGLANSQKSRCSASATLRQLDTSLPIVCYSAFLPNRASEPRLHNGLQQKSSGAAPLH